MSTPDPTSADRDGSSEDAARISAAPDATPTNETPRMSASQDYSVNDRLISSQVKPLVEAIVTDTATNEQVVELEGLLLKHSSARAYFIDYVNLHSALRQRFFSEEFFDRDNVHASFEELLAEHPESLASLLHTEGTLPRSSRINTLWLAGLSTLAASLLLTGALLWSSSGEPLQANNKSLSNPPGNQEALPTDAPQMSADQKASLNGVAILSKSIDVKWAPGSEEHQAGQPVPKGLVVIDSGIIQIEFYCGAVAVLEGPASFDLESADRGFIHFGKIRTVVPAHAKGFTIGTKNGDVVDLGTEFAIDVPTEGPSELHVLDGEVDFYHTDNQSNGPRRLIGGQAIDLEKASPDNPLVDSNADRFVSAQQLNALSDQRFASRFEQWKAYKSSLLQDEALIAYYTFDEEPSWSRTLVNQAPLGAEGTDGAIVGCSAVSGRWPGSRALMFRNASHRVRVNIPGEFDSLTLSAWIKVDAFQGTNSIALLHPEETGQSRFIHWTLDRSGEGASLHFSDTTLTNDKIYDPNDRIHYGSVKHAIWASDLDRWVHVAFTYDPRLRRITHYRDGQVLGTETIKAPRKLSIGIADLGNWPYRDWARGTEFETRNLNGEIDEFAILKRAMSEEEILSMYQAGKP